MPPQFPTRRYWTVLCLLVALFVVPALVALGANGVLALNGCSFDLKGGTHCFIGGNDWGNFLGTTLLASWALAALGMWAAIGGGVVLLAVLAVHLVVRKRKAVA